MAITKTIVVNADLKKAQEEFDAFDRSVKDTNESIQTLERDLLKLEKEQSKHSAGSMRYKQLNKDIKAHRIRLKEERMDLKELNGERSKAKKKLDDMLIRENRLKIAQECFKFIEYRVSLDLQGWSELDIFSH